MEVWNHRMNGGGKIRNPFQYILDSLNISKLLTHFPQNISKIKPLPHVPNSHLPY